MPTVDTLLQELGPPPRDICLDWAWQIQILFAECGQQPAIGTTPLAWNNLELDECGLLRLRNVTEACRPEQLLRQLVAWIEGGAREDDTKLPHTDSLPALMQRFRELILAEPDSSVLNRELQEISDNDASESSSQVNSLRKNEEHSHAQCLLNGSSVASQPTDHSRHSRDQTDARVSVRQSSRSLQRANAYEPKPKLSSQFLKPRVLAIAGILTGTIPLLLYLASNLLSSSAEDLSIASMGSESPQNTTYSSTTSPRAASNSDAEKNLMEVSQSVPPAMELSQDALADVISGQANQNDVAAANALSRFTDPLIDLPASSVPGKSKDSAFDEKSLSVTEAHTTAPTENLTINEVPDGKPEAQVEANTANTDVLSEVRGASKSAGAVQSETELMVGQQNEVIPEPLLLATSPAIQIQKLPPRLTPRPRQPMWRMAIGVDDEFTVSPSEPVTLKEKEFASWTIASSDAKAPRTSLKIGVQMSSGRQAALRWTIAAVSDDLPDLTLPLGEKILQPLQDKLRLFSQAAPQEVERLKQLAASGVPSEVRSAINRERAALDSQGKFAARMLTFVASAQQLDAWLHGHVTVFAELRDGTEADSPIVLRFGDLEHLTTSEQPAGIKVIDKEKSDTEATINEAKSE